MSYERVVFESDQTCCKCRDRSRPVKIHHIDGNHSNDERSNLAVLCDPCHTLAHTHFPFAQNLTADLVRIYDENWRAICASKLSPETPAREPETAARETEEYCQEVLLELSLACHEWKNAYIDFQPRNLEIVTGNFKDVWDRLMDAGQHDEESAEEWNKYHPLFDQSINRVISNLRSILTCHGDVVPARLKTLVIRTVRQLTVERLVYELLGPTQTSVKMRTQGVIRALAMLARAADAGTTISPVVHWRE